MQSELAVLERATHRGSESALRRTHPNRSETISGKGVRVLGWLLRESRATQSQLAVALDMNPSSLSRTVTQLETHDWLRRQVDDDDARVRYVTLTAEGRQVAEVLGATDSVSRPHTVVVRTSDGGEPAGVALVAQSERRLSRSERKARTKAELLRAARKVFLRSGYHGATLEEVAQEAGFTKGAVYSTFDGKGALMLELLDQRIGQHTRSVQRAIAELDDGGTTTEWVRSVQDNDKRWSALTIEFWAHAARDPQLRSEFAIRHHRQKDEMTKLLQEEAESRNVQPEVSPADTARILMALTKGFALELMLDTEPDSQHLLETTLTTVIKTLLGQSS